MAFCPGEERRMAPLAGEVHMDAFLRLPFVLDEAWEDQETITVKETDFTGEIHYERVI